MVEFALIATVLMMVLLVGIQFALVGQAALAVNQAAYAGSRYGSVNPCATASDIAAYVAYAASPTITGSSCGHLTVKLNNTSGSMPGSCPPGSAPTPTACGANPPTRAFGTTVTVSLSYDTVNQIVLPNPFLGISFPSTLTAQESTMSE